MRKFMQLYQMNYSHSYTILVVEDEIILREYLTELLELEGYLTRWAGTAAEAVDVLKQHSVDAVITDFHLGEDTGLVVLDYLQTHQPSVPCLIMSAEWNTSYQDMCKQAGGNGVIKKPFDNQDLLLSLKGALLKR